MSTSEGPHYKHNNKHHKHYNKHNKHINMYYNKHIKHNKHNTKHNSKRFATPADPLRPMDVCMFRDTDVQLL